MIFRSGLFAAILITVSFGSAASTFAHERTGTVRAAVIPKAAVGGSGAWTTYHFDDGHTGYDPGAPALSTVQPTPGWTNTTLDGEVFAEPLIFNGVVYAATLNNTVYALDQATGAVLWSKNVGAPQTGGWDCGNISPTGILGTPVIDTAANRIYAVAEIGGTTPTYRLFGLDLGNNGNIVLNTAISPSGFDWKTEQERGALALRNGFVYVPFGGRAGDCANKSTGVGYHGYVVGVPTNGSAPISYQFPGPGIGSWAAGGVVIDDVNGNVFVSTGNGISARLAPGGPMVDGCGVKPDGSPLYANDSVLLLNSGLAPLNYFMPLDWHSNWCINDMDLGSAGPLLISHNLMFQAGKWGGGFLVNPNALGGVNGQLFPSPSGYSQAEVCLGNHINATFGSFAYAAPFVYVECESRGLVAINVNTSTPSFTQCNAGCAAPDWHAGGTTTYGPPIVAAGAVWVASNNGLTAYNATTGALIYQSASFGVNRFVTPAEAGGQVFVPSHTVIRSFSFAATAGSVTVTPTSVGFGGQAPGTTSGAQTVTLHNNQNVVLNVSSVAVTGTNAASYVKGADGCTGIPVAANGTCTVQVSFKPGGFGSFPASLTFTDNGPTSSQGASLNGTGALDNQSHLYTLDGWGGVHADGGSPALNASQYWPGWNIARSLALFPDGTGGYSLDGWGGLHPVGNANPVNGTGYWPGWDIARQVVLAPWSNKASPAGWVLDGWGGIHEFGGAPQLHNYAWWPGWDIARGLAILPDSTPGSVAGYTMDGWGGIHEFGGAPVIANATYWSGWDIGRGITLSANSSKSNPAGWTVDGYGGVHPFGSAPAVSTTAYWAGWDIGRGIVAWTGPGAGNGGWVMDGWGGLHPFGSGPPISSFAYWSGWDIATSLAGSGGNSGSRQRT